MKRSSSVPSKPSSGFHCLLVALILFVALSQIILHSNINIHVDVGGAKNAFSRMAALKRQGEDGVAGVATPAPKASAFKEPDGPPLGVVGGGGGSSGKAAEPKGDGGQAAANQEPAPALKGGGGGVAVSVGEPWTGRRKADGGWDGPTPVVLQLSQGRSGSTVSGALILEKHPYCGMYVDELVWVVYRSGMGQEGSADQQPAVDAFFNTTQCDLPKPIFHDEAGALDWFVKRNRYANAGKGHKSDYYTRTNQQTLCDATRTQGTAVCSKEIRFLGHTAALLRTASERKIPFTLIYQMRDPRASVLSQMWVFSSIRFAENRTEGEQAVKMLKEHCSLAAQDLSDMHNAPKEIRIIQVCFEDLHEDPKGTLMGIYDSLPEFIEHTGQVIPPEVEKYGRDHMALWENSTSSVEDIPNWNKSDGPGIWYKGQIMAHRYSTDKTRAKHVYAWHEVIMMPRYNEFRDTWQNDENCKTIQRLSECNRVWEEGDREIERTREKIKKERAEKRVHHAERANGASAYVHEEKAGDKESRRARLREAHAPPSQKGKRHGGE